MKNYLPYLIVLACCFAGCKKDKKGDSSTDTKTYPVVFNTAGPSQTANASKQKNNSLKTNVAGPVGNSATRLYYAVFDSNNVLIHALAQDSSLSNFGKITDNLPAGTYTVNICAGQSPLKSSAYLVAAANPTVGSPWKDTFFKKIPITVTSAGVNQDVTLERIVAQLQINIEDALPANSSKLVINIVNEYLDFHFDGTMSSVIKYTINNPIPAAAIGTSNYKITTLIGNTVQPMSVQIICYDAANKILVDKTIGNVQCNKNVRTILSGKLFSAANNFTVGLNNTWDPTPYTTVEY